MRPEDAPVRGILPLDPGKRRGGGTKSLEIFRRPSIKKQSKNTFVAVLTSAIHTVYGHSLKFPTTSL